MEGGHDAFLEFGFEIDQHVAATDQIDAGEGGIGEEILAGEDDLLAEGFDDAVAALFFHEESAGGRGGHRWQGIWRRCRGGLFRAWIH